MAPTFTLEAGLPLVVADRSQIQQLIMNLVVNGVESHGEEAGSVRVRTRTVQLRAADARGQFRAIGSGAGSLRGARGDGHRQRHERCGSGPDLRPLLHHQFTGRGLGLAAVHGIVQGQRPRSPLRRCPPPASLFDSSEALERRLRCRMAELSRTALHAAAWRAVARDSSSVSGIATVAGALP